MTRRYDEALRPVGITTGQFSILAIVAADLPIGVGGVAERLGMDRTTLTAAVKPLERDGLIVCRPDPEDGRGRRMALTDKGRATLKAALPLWSNAQAKLARRAKGTDLGNLRAEIMRLA